MSKYINNKSWSICAWINTTSSDTCVISLSYGLRMFAGNSTHTYITLYNSSRTVNCISSVASNDGKWHHLCATYDVNTNNIKFYVDGINTGNANYTSGYTYASSWANGIFIGRDPNNSTVNDHYLFKGRMNDVRIYDHALSAKEVKELSKGLVAHYPLIKNGDNLLKYIPKSHNSASYLGYRLNLSENLIAGETYTIQLWNINVSHSAKTADTLSVACFWGSGYVLLSEWKGTNYIINGHADYLTRTFTVTEAQASGRGAENSWLEFYNSPSNADGTRTMEFEKWKIEKGSKATPWIPNVNDEEYSLMGYNSNKILDTSGNNYNLTINGTPTCNTDSPRNSACTNFVSPSNAYCTTFSPTGYTNSYSISFWAIYTNNGMAFAHANGNRLNLWFNSGKILWNTGDGGNNPFQNNGTDISNTPYLNSWHHYVITADGTSNKLYIDGEYVGTAKTFRPLTGTTLVLSGWTADTSTSYRLNSSISDFRLYSTALSVDDVKQLYNTPISIAKNGSILTQGEYIE
jgi:hypothetical protein